MATESNSGIVNSHSKQEPTMQTDTEINSKSLESGQALPAESVPNPDQSRSEETKPAGDSNPVDPSTSPEQALAGAVTGAQQPSTATARAGDKQEYNPSSAPANQDKAVPGESTEPARKKQKISEENGVVGNGQPASRATGNSTSKATRNGEKKAGRSKKVKDTVKRIIQSDGIGSRTRSRTKAATT
ncbi:hypothetical protein CNMCM5793_009433 [Aspergillus hiratsukae]|uniref:Uncharacterized protein n=1 Tax=Aspergillus hiratsukae TaxID=1194566 RepID=A0A8H6QJT2_9EURO|nr:hypothetical protein CNMCM5793_009433 [Aspergillus hiratsukae]KAF7173167.1 hypothetical protein CNMCM6106_007275 [Aspergillus hiratsukae]